MMNEPNIRRAFTVRDVENLPANFDRNLSRSLPADCLASRAALSVRAYASSRVEPQEDC
jgi:hypothetical protein